MTPDLSPASAAHVRLWIFLFFAGLFLFTVSGYLRENPDTDFMFGVGQGLARSGRMAVPEDAAPIVPGAPNAYDHLRGRDGALYFPKGLTYSAAMVPFILVAQAVCSLAGAPTCARLTMLSASAVAPLCAALNCVLVLEILLAFGFARSLAIIVTLGTGLGTILWSASADGALESLTGVLITAVYLGLVRLHRDPAPLWSAWTGGALALLVLAQPVMLGVVVPLTMLYAGGLAMRFGLTSRMIKVAITGAVPVALGLGAAAWTNAIRYGGPLTTGYEWAASGPMSPLYVGLYGLLFSAGKSIFLYSPLLILAAFGSAPFVRRVGWLGTFPFALLGAFLLVYGRLPYWHGDGAWGPRYLIPLTGSLCTPLAAFLQPSRLWLGRWKQVMLAVCVALGVAVNVIGVSTSTSAYFWILIKARIIVPPPGFPRWSPVLFDPELSPIVGRAHVVASALHRGRYGTSLSWRVPLRNGKWAALSLEDIDEWEPWFLRLRPGKGPGRGVGARWQWAVPWAWSFAALLAILSVFSAARLRQLSRGAALG